MKKICGMILLLCMVFSVLVVCAEKDISVFVDGEKISFDQAPFIKDNRTLVPLRAIFEALGCRVEYDAELKMVHATRGTQYSLSLTIGETDLYKNGKIITMDVPAMIVNSRTFVPLRAISEALDTDVEWDGELRKITVKNRIGYGIKTHYLAKDYLAADGTVLIRYFYAYPELPNQENSEKIKALNQSFYERAVLHQQGMEEEWLSVAEEAYAMAQADGLMWYAYVCEHSFDITYDVKPVLSIKESDYSFFNGAHPNTNTDAYTYNLTSGELLTLNDVFSVEEKEAQDRILTAFYDWCDMFALEDEVRNAMKENIDKVSFYLTNDATCFFFDVYVVGPYALGEPEASIRFNLNEKLFRPWLYETNPERQIP